MIGWLKQRWPIVAAAIACSVFVVYSDRSTAVKVVAVVLCMGAITLWNLARNLRVHTMINRHAALGQPESMLALVDAELASKTSDQARLPFLIYKATALSLCGHWDDALSVLDAANPKQVGGNAGRTWRFLHATQRVSCLLSLERLNEAREAFANELEPFARLVSSPATQVIVDESEAKFAFFDQRYDDSRETFKALVADERIVPASRAVYRYYLGRIALATGTDPGEHFVRARELAPETYIPTSIDELLERADADI